MDMSIFNVNQVTQQLPSIEGFIASLASNEFFIGLALSSVLLSLLYILRGVPAMIYNFLKRHLTTELEMHNDHFFFEHFLWWYTENGYMNRARRLSINRKMSKNNGNKNNAAYNFLSMGPGDGLQILWYKGRPLFLTKETKDHKTRDVPITITLRKLGRGKQLFKDIIDEAKQEFEQRDGITLYSVNDGFASEIGIKPYRHMESIFIPQKDKEELIDNIQWFINSKQWYNDLGIPYRRSMLLYGPPGTGKTSLAHALGSYFDRDIYLLNLTSIASDKELMDAINDVRENNILVIEDVDTVGATHSRSSETDGREGGVNTPVKKDNGDSYSLGITMGGLLNALDGIQSREGLITIMTTNHPEKLDPALKRAGRMDFKLYIGLMQFEERRKIFERFYPEHAGQSERFAELVGEKAPCDIQELLLRYQRNPDQIIPDLENGNVRI